MDKVTNIGAAALAGGKNSRMSGFNKAFIEIGGTRIIQRTIRLLHRIFDEIIIVTNSPEDFRLYKNKAIITEDILKNFGPLGGMHSALSTTSKEAVFFVACDMPFLHNEVIRQQLGYFNKIDCDVLVPRIGHLIEPLHAVYKRGLKDNIQNFLQKNSGHSIKGFLKTANVAYFDLDKKDFYRRAFININTPQELRKVRTNYGNKI